MIITTIRIFVLAAIVLYAKNEYRKEVQKINEFKTQQFLDTEITQFKKEKK